MVVRLARVVAMVCGLACAFAAPARAGDWLFTPFIGTTFAPDTNVAPLGTSGGRKKVTIGGAAGFLTDGVFGAEASASYSFGFFKDQTSLIPSAVQHSAAGTLMGDALFAVPIAVVHESLRPYAAVGVGLMHARVEYQNDLLPLVSRNLTAMDVGGGAIGFINRRAGFRFDLRRFRSVERGTAALTPNAGGSRLTFWRVSVGVVVRY